MYFNDEDFARSIIWLALIAAAVGAALAIGLPWLWSLIRPWLHMVTA
jgi:hypothetical protein